MENRKKTYFASDFHFGIPDQKSSLKREIKFVNWLDTIKDDASEIFLLGDLFDFWFEYKKVVPKGYTRLFGKLAEITDSGIDIHFFRGNHDMWAFDYLADELGIKLYRKPQIREIMGKKFFLAHGDGLGTGDKGYKFIKWVFEQPVNQWLFNWLHPDIGMRLGLFWSRRSRYANLIREEKQNKKNKKIDFENARLGVFCKEKLKKDETINYFIFGHWHTPNIFPLNNKSFYIHLGDWITYFSYGVFYGERFELKLFG